MATDDPEFVLVGVGGRMEGGRGLGDGMILVDEACFSSDGAVCAAAVGV